MPHPLHKQSVEHPNASIQQVGNNTDTTVVAWFTLPAICCQYIAGLLKNLHTVRKVQRTDSHV